MRLNPRLKRFARRMRHVPTRAEQRRWRWLRHREFRGCKFRRQYPAGSFILDFYSPALRLAIELDGKQHQEAGMTEYDFRRSRYLEAHAIKVVRISNELLIRDARAVFEQIAFAVDSLIWW
ncbi:MAG: endonuclease domain-containing protein [Thermoanaerobaculia bacterium]